MDQENLKFIHDTIIRWISRTENKANIFLGIHLVILGYFISFLDSLSLDKWYKLGILGLFLAFSVIVLFLIFKIIWPKLSTNKSTTSFIYFKHIHDKYVKNRDRALGDFDRVSKHRIKKDLINQIVSLSVVATSKYKALQKVIICLGIVVVLIIALFII